MRKNSVCAVVLAMAMLIGAAPATSAHADRVRVHEPAEVRVVDSLLAGDVADAMVASLGALGGDEEVLAAMAEGSVAEQLLPVADLDGDGLPDVLGLAGSQPVEPVQGAVGPTELSVTARSGRDGAELWSRTVGGAAGVALDVPDGILLVTVQLLGNAMVQRLTSLDAEGDLRWERMDAGTVGTTAVQWPAYVGALGQPDGSVQHLVQQVNYTVLQQNTSEPGSVTAYVLDDADGAELHELERSGEGVPWAHAAPDLDGDGADDVLLTQSFSSGERGEVLATTADGTQLWSGTGPFRSNGFVIRPGDTDGDGVEDVAIGSGGTSVGLLSGADGSTTWEMPGEWPSAVGDVDGDGLPDVGVRDIGGSSFSSFTTMHSAYTGDGTQLYRTQRGVPIDSRNYSSWTTTFLLTADVDGDGVQDTFHSFELVYDDGERLEDAAATSGRTGEPIWSDDRLPMSLGTSVQGPGVDFARVQANGTQAFVEVLRGDTLAPVWRTGVPMAGAMRHASAVAADLTGDGIGDVLVSAGTYGSAGSTVLHGFVLDGRTGMRLW